MEEVLSLNLDNNSNVINTNGTNLNAASTISENNSISSITIKYPMLLFTKDSSYKNRIKTFQRKLLHKSLLVFSLNVTDIIFTWFFVVKNNNLFLELNPFGKEIIHNLPLALCTKLTIVTLVLIYLMQRTKNATPKGVKLINLTINMILILYLVINTIHILNSTFLFYIINYF